MDHFIFLVFFAGKNKHYKNIGPSSKKNNVLILGRSPIFARTLS
jgi:hypothetical protein